jgi:hypothetical protein
VIKEFRLSIEKILESHNLAFDLGSKINPSAQVVYIQPKGLMLVVLSSTLEDYSIEKVANILAGQSKEWWLQDSEITLTPQLELKGM